MAASICEGITVAMGGRTGEGGQTKRGRKEKEELRREASENDPNWFSSPVLGRCSGPSPLAFPA